jgi:6-phosphogluconolactonase
VQRVAAELLVAAAKRGDDIALSGGSTPGPAYELAAQLEPDWGPATIWWVDERCAPPDDERSNYRLVRETLLERLERPPHAVHRIRGELDPEQAAEEYDRLLDGVRLGLAFQGMGADGHTASLFPGSTALEERERRAVAVSRADIERVTMTLPVLSAARQVVFLVLGTEKADAVARAFGAEPDPALPAALLRSQEGGTVVLLDRAAAAKLDN